MIETEASATTVPGGSTKHIYNDKETSKFSSNTVALLGSLLTKVSSSKGETESTYKVYIICINKRRPDLCICMTPPCSWRNNGVLSRMHAGRRTSQKERNSLAQTHSSAPPFPHKAILLFVLRHSLPCPQSRLCKGF